MQEENIEKKNECTQSSRYRNVRFEISWRRDNDEGKQLLKDKNNASKQKKAKIYREERHEL